MKNQRGFTLVEALVTTALFVTMVMAIQTVTLNMTRGGIKVNQKARLQKIARSVLYQLASASQRFPGIVRDARFADPKFQAFDDPTIADQTCFNEEGGQVALDAKDCVFKVSSYQVQMVSTDYAYGSDLAPLPLYRLYVRFRYNEDATVKTFVVSQFLTPSLRQ